MKIKIARLIGLLILALVVSAQAVEMVPIQIAPGDQGQPAPAPPPQDMDDNLNNPPPAMPAIQQGSPAAAPVRGAPPGMAASNPPPAVATKSLKPGQMLFNFQDADIQAVVKTISQISGRNFLLDPRVKGKVTIISAKPVAKEAAYEIFVSALKAQGFTTVEGPGGIVKIVPEAEAKLSTGVRSGPYARNSDQWSTHVVVVQHASAPQLVPMLRPLMSPTALLSVYQPGNVLVITDTAASIRNVLKVIEKIDQPGSTEVTIIPIQNASVIDLAQLVGRFAEGAQISAQPGQPPIPGLGAAADNRLVVVPDLRTNSLLVRADNPGRVAELRALVAKLDVPAKSGGQTHVVYLRNAEAKKLVEVLRGLLAGESRSAGGVGAAAVPGAAAAAGAPASLIQADETSNALIISANDSTYNNLRGVIEKLDQRRAQVYVEALIVELQTDLALQFGIQWAAGSPSGTGTGTGLLAGVQNFPAASGAGILDTAVAKGLNLAGANGLTLGYIGREIALPDTACKTPPCTARGLGALARALESNTKANVLSTPNMVMLDNAEAKIVVGQNVPFVTGSFAQATGTAGAAVNPFQTIERKDVGLTLKIKPQISEGGGVKLVINQEMSSVAPSAQSASDLITNKRSLDTTVIIDDGDTMVLGGLIEDKTSNTISQVPILGSIPIIGELFKYRSRSKGKTNLMIFLRPVIIRNANDTYRVTADRYDTIGAGNRSNRGERAEIMQRFKPVKPVPKPVEKDAVEKDAGATDPGEAKHEGEPQAPVAGSPAADTAGPKTAPE